MSGQLVYNKCENVADQQANKKAAFKSLVYLFIGQPRNPNETLT